MIKELRDNDFRERCLQIFRELEAEGTAPSLRRVVRRAIDSPAPSYYISSEYAYSRLCGKAPLPEGDSPRARMWREIAAAVAEVRERRGCCLTRALGTVLNFGRPSSFFLSMEEGMRIAGKAFERRTVYRPRRSAKGGVSWT